MGSSGNRSIRGSRAHLGAAVLALMLASGPASAQLPRVGIIDFYGLRTLEPADLANALALQIGDSLTVPAAVLRERLLGVPGVRDATVNTVCCEGGRTIVYVGIREARAETIEFDAAPNGSARLPAEVVKAADEFMNAVFEGVRSGQNAEDDSEGHAVPLYAPARASQQKLIDYAIAHVAEIRGVLKTAGDPRQRALAAQMIAYTKDKALVVADLVTATRDPDANVRNNAVRALAVMAIYEQKHPDANFKISYAPFIDLLNSLEWTDRNKAAFALTALTEPRDPDLLRELRERAIESLVEMARWRAFGHAAAAGMILGRIGGLAENEIFALLQKNREAVIAAALKR